MPDDGYLTQEPRAERSDRRAASGAMSGTERGGPPVPVMPSILLNAIERGIVDRRMVFPDEGGHRVIETWVAIRLAGAEVDACRAYVDGLNEVLQPAPGRMILARILTLLSHYGGETRAPEVETAMASDWAEDLSEYPIWAIEQAARHWRRTQKFKPRICEIRSLCDAAVAEHRKLLARLEACLNATPSSPQTEVMANRVATISRSLFRKE